MSTQLTNRPDSDDTAAGKPTQVADATDRAEQALSKIVTGFFRNGLRWAGNVKDALMAVGKGTFVLFAAMQIFALGIVISVLWKDPVLMTILKVAPAAVGLALVAYAISKMSRTLGWAAYVVTALMLFSVVVLGAASAINHVAGKPPVDPTLFYGKIASWFDFERTPLVVTETNTVYRDRTVEVPGETVYVDRTIEVPVSHKGMIKALICEDRTFKRCAVLLRDQVDWDPNDIGFTPRVGIAEDGWAVVGINMSTGEEAWRIQQGWRELDSNEQRFRWVKVKPLP